MNERMDWDDVSTIVRKDGRRAVSVRRTSDKEYPWEVTFENGSVMVYTNDGFYRLCQRHPRFDLKPNAKPNAKPKPQFEQVRMRNGDLATVYTRKGIFPFPIHGTYGGSVMQWGSDGRCSLSKGCTHPNDLILDKHEPACQVFGTLAECEAEPKPEPKKRYFVRQRYFFGDSAFSVLDGEQVSLVRTNGSKW